MLKTKWPSWPQYTKKEQNLVSEIVKSNQLFAEKNVKRFENSFKKYVGSRYSVGLGNATQGLHLALAALNIGENDEVITTPFSWISSTSCILMQNAVPIFADCDAQTLSLNPKEVEKKITKYTKAIIMVHLFGYPSNILEIRKIAKKYKIFLIEDASHAHGMKIEKQLAGTFGDISVFSLHQRKAIPVGDGGIITTNSKKIADKIYRLRSFGDEELSYNYRMNEFAGALGTSRLLRLNADNKIRRKNANFLHKEFKENKYIKTIVPKLSTSPVYHKFLFRLNAHKFKKNLTEIAELIQKEGVPIIATKVGWNLLHRHLHFNPKKIPARGIPWRNKSYKGVMKKILSYKKLKFPIIENVVDNELLELPINPPVDIKLLRKASLIIKKILKRQSID